jgi:FkbM family methyltransferase
MLIDLSEIYKKYKLDITNLVHIGVNNGLEVGTYRELLPNSKIYLIEPQKEQFNKLVKRYEKDKRIILYNTALGNEIGKSEMNISPTHKGSASLLEPTLHKTIFPEVEFQNTESVNLDKYENLNLKNVNFLNIDVQGYELNVLKGAGKKLIEIDYIMTEISTKALYKDSALLDDIDSYLNQYKFIRLITVFWDSKCIWGDAFYINKNLISKNLIWKTKIKNFLYKSKFIYNSYQLARKINS